MRLTPTEIITGGSFLLTGLLALKVKKKWVKILLGGVAILFLLSCIWSSSADRNATTTVTASATNAVTVVTTGTGSPATVISGNSGSTKVIQDSPSAFISGDTFIGSTVINGPVIINTLTPEQFAELQRQNFQPDNRQTLIDTNYPGYSVVIVMSLCEIHEKRTKLIFGFGEGLPESTRKSMTVAMGEDNSLELLVVDSMNNPYLLRIPPYKLKFNQIAYFTFEAGNKNDSTSFLRISMNGAPVDIQEFHHPMDIPTYGKGLSVGKDFMTNMSLAIVLNKTYSAKWHESVVRACSHLLLPGERPSNTK